MQNQQRDESKQPRHRFLSLPLIIIGVVAVVFAVAFDPANFGRYQLAISAAGLILLLAGIGLQFSKVRRSVILLIRKLTGHIQTTLTPWDYVLLAIWFGLVTGLLEAVFQIVKNMTMHTVEVPNLTSIDVIWMAPLTDAILFAGLGLIVAYVVWVWPELVPFPIAVFVFAFLGFLALLILLPGLNLLPELLLATGLATQFARLATFRASRFEAIVRWTGGWIGVLGRNRRLANAPAPAETVNTNSLPSRRQFLLGTGVALIGLAAGAVGGRELVQRINLAGLPPAKSGAPNVLFIVLDTVRAQNLSLYGYPRSTTPNLERLAERGVLFRRAISAAPWTLPSHATMFTGRWHHELSVNWQIPLDDTYPTLAEALSRQGYNTVGMVANLSFCNSMFGLNRGFLHYEDWPITPGQALVSTSLGRKITDSGEVRKMVGYYDLLNRKNAASITDDFLRWQGSQNRQPFFAFLNYYDAHQLYLPPPPFDTLFGPKRSHNDFTYFTNGAEVEAMWMLSPSEVQAELDAYDGAIAYLDNQLDRLLAELARRGVLENTLVIVTSDHGEQFGEHGLFGHTNSLYMQALHVPLLMLWPSSLPAGIEVSDSISLRDMPATIFDILGLDSDVGFPGASLARYWQTPSSNPAPATELLLSEITQGTFPQQEWYPTFAGDLQSIVRGQHHYIKWATNKEELYDLADDPFEENDLANQEGYRSLVAELRNSLDRKMGFSPPQTTRF